jgi:two-component system sensor histidine kinase/response regulator
MSNRAGPTPRVLVAEDHPLNQRVTTVMLKQLGFDVDVVSDGAAAVRAATRTAYHAIFMDCQIPVLDGYRAAAAIRLHSGPTWRAPIIAVTASGAESNRQRCLDAGMDDFLTKPLSMKTLAAALARVASDRSVDDRAGSAASNCMAPNKDGTGRSVLDVEVVARLERLGEAAGQDLFRQLSMLFLADAGTLLAALRDALGRNDAAAVVEVAHTLGGAGANLGATELARACAQLSATAANGARNGAGSVFDAVEGELRRVCAALDTSVLTP